VQRKSGDWLICDGQARRWQGRALGDQGDLDDHPCNVISDNDARALDTDDLASGQLELVHRAARPAHQVARVILDGRLLHRCEKSLGGGVGHDNCAADSHDCTVRACFGADECLEQGLLALAAVDQQVALDVVGRRPDQRVHQWTRMLGHAADVQDAFDTATERVPDRATRAGEWLQTLMKVLGSHDLNRLPGLEDRAHAIGPHASFGIVEARGEPDVVQEQTYRPGVVHAGEHPGLAVGEGDTQRDVRGLLAQTVNDWSRAADQPRRDVQV
jgi:hypothetical protein